MLVVMSIEQEVSQHLRAGRAGDAERILRGRLELAPQDAGLRAMLAQVLAATGRKDEAIAELSTAVEQAPGGRGTRLLLARLANERGRNALAEQHARILTAANPADSEAWSALGFAASRLGKPRAALEALRRAVSLAPNYAAARYNLAAVLCEQERSEEALVETGEAMRVGARHRGAAVVRARALVQLDRHDEAERLLLQLLAENPADDQGHVLLVRLRRLRGDADPLRDLRGAAGAMATPAMRLAYADALRRSGEHAAAVETLQRLIAELGRAPLLLASMATVLQESGQMDAAFGLSAEALAGAGDDAGIAETFAVSAIATRHLAEALPVVEAFRAARPRDQRWITHRIDIARLRGEQAFDDWFDPARVIRTFELPAPTDALRCVLDARHHGQHPLDQSLRNGTQTSRNLLVCPEPELVSLFESFEAALVQYQGEIGQNAEHPLLSRNVAPAALMGCWSVRLRAGGHHVNHIHPEGWVSSAYYVSVPDEVADENARAGWLKFGEPRFPVEGLGSFEFVRPLPGRLVLFPSYLWHGTTPLRGDSPRMSVAFDAVPRTEMQ